MFSINLCDPSGLGWRKIGEMNSYGSYLYSTIAPFANIFWISCEMIPCSFSENWLIIHRFCCGWKINSNFSLMTVMNTSFIWQLGCFIIKAVCLRIEIITTAGNCVAMLVTCKRCKTDVFTGTKTSSANFSWAERVAASVRVASTGVPWMKKDFPFSACCLSQYCCFYLTIRLKTGLEIWLGQIFLEQWFTDFFRATDVV